MRDRYVEQYKPDIRTESSTDNFDEDEKSIRARKERTAVGRSVRLVTIWSSEQRVPRQCSERETFGGEVSGH